MKVTRYVAISCTCENLKRGLLPESDYGMIRIGGPYGIREPPDLEIREHIGLSSREIFVGEKRDDADNKAAFAEKNRSVRACSGIRS